MKRLILNAGGIGGHPEGIKPIVDHFAGCKRVAFVPYAYVGKPSDIIPAVSALLPGIPFVNIHAAPSPAEVLKSADGIWVSGGNSFMLADALHRHSLIDPVRAMVEAGIPYAGASAGANVAGPTICTTNDMPIRRMPRSLDAFGLVPFQINPHYLDANALPPDFRGETREQRLREFLGLNEVTVVGLREGTWLVVNRSAMHLAGSRGAMIFERGKEPREVPPGADLSGLLAASPRFDVIDPHGPFL